MACYLGKFNLSMAIKNYVIVKSKIAKRKSTIN